MGYSPYAVDVGGCSPCDEEGGVIGPTGKSAYQVAVEFDGFTGTEQEWLDSLVGPQGEQGIQGIQGEQGIQGIQGEKGDKGDKGDTGGFALDGEYGDINIVDGQVEIADTVMSTFGRSIAIAGNAAAARYVLGLTTITPLDFGAVPYDPTNEVDCSDQLQAFFDHARNEENARKFYYDWSGEWGVSKTIYACYYDGHEPAVERRFGCGTLRVMPTADGAPLPFALEIATTRSSWDGRLGVHHALPNNHYGVGYYYRRYIRGIRIRACSFSTFDSLMVDDSRRDAVLIDTTLAPFTVSYGDLPDLNFPNANSIGLKIGMIAVRFAGSCPSQFTMATPLIVTANEPGGATGAAWTNAEGFTGASPYDYSNSGWQRSRLTVDSTADLEVWDVVWSRLELTPDIYGTIEADNATRSFIWSAGDPTNIDGAGNGLQVGDIYPYFPVGPNAGVEFRITGFGGVSNRTIFLDKAPVTHAATADASYAHNGPADWHFVSSVEDATHVRVYPWVPKRNNSKLYITHGAALHTKGVDGANTQIGTLEGFACGISYFSGALYAAKIGTLLAEVSEVGAVFGYPNEALNCGNVISHSHLEANRLDILQAGITSGYIDVGSNLASWRGVQLSVPRGGPNSQVGQPGRLSLIISNGSQLYTSEGRTVNEQTPYTANFYGISNGRLDREVYVHENTLTVPVHFDYDTARLFPNNNVASLIWTGPVGDKPTGTLTLELDPALVNQGWLFAGADDDTSYTITAPEANVRLDLQYITAYKRVAITRLNHVDVSNKLTANYGAWYGPQDAKITNLQGIVISGDELVEGGAADSNGRIELIVRNSTSGKPGFIQLSSHDWTKFSYFGGWSANDRFLVSGSHAWEFGTAPYVGTNKIIDASALDTDGALAANSDTKVATQKAVKTYVDTPRLQTVVSAATVTPTFQNDLVKVTAQAVALAIANPTGTAIPGHGFAIRIKDDGTARAITYGTQYRAIGVTLPVTTVAGKTLYLGCIWNSDDNKIDVVAVRQEA